MFVIWGMLDPMIIGEVAEGLTPAEEALGILQLGLDNEVLSNILSLLCGFCWVGIFVGLTLLARSLQAGGANLGAICSLIFPAMIAIAIVGFGLSLEATNLLKEGYSENAVSMEIISTGVFGAVPMFWGLGVALLGLAITRENGHVPATMGWILALCGIGMLSGTFIDFNSNPLGMVIWLGMSIAVVATGVVSLRRAP
jgi:hypothetical protein